MDYDFSIQYQSTISGDQVDALSRFMYEHQNLGEGTFVAAVSVEPENISLLTSIVRGHSFWPPVAEVDSLPA